MVWGVCDQLACEGLLAENMPGIGIPKEFCRREKGRVYCVITGVASPPSIPCDRDKFGEFALVGREHPCIRLEPPPFVTHIHVGLRITDEELPPGCIVVDPKCAVW